MIVRELVAVLGLDFDERQFEQADQRFESLKRGAAALGAVLLSGAVAKGLVSLVRRASDVQETENLLTVAFDENAEAVKSWANVTASEVGRSEFKLRELAASVGAVAQTMLGTGDETTKLSTDMAKLAVDLGSVFNVSDNEALTALRAGLVGETEPMRRFGVTLTQAAIQEFAMAKGIHKTMEAMSEAEKLQLRYAFIMERTTRFQGDAQRTAKEFANSSKFLMDRLGDLGIKIGQALLPGATKLVHIATSLIDRFLVLAETTKIIETTLVVLATIAAGVGIALVLPFLPAILTAALLAAAIGAVILVVEDLYQFITGGQSLTGDALRGMGVDVDRVRRVFEKAGEVISQIWNKLTEKVGQFASKMNIDVGGAVEWIGRVLDAFFAWAEPKLDALLNIDFEAKKQQIGEYFNEWKTKIQEFLASPLGKALSTLVGAWAGSKLGGMAGSGMGEAFGHIAGRIVGPGETGKKISSAIGGWMGSAGGGLLGNLYGGFMGAKGALDVGQAWANDRGSIPAPGERNVNVSSDMMVTVNGSASEEQKETFRDIVREENERVLRDAQRALVPVFHNTGKL